MSLGSDIDSKAGADVFRHWTWEEKEQICNWTHSQLEFGGKTFQSLQDPLAAAYGGSRHQGILFSMFYLLFLQFCILDPAITLISSSINCFIAVGKCHQKHLVIVKILPKIFKSLPLATRQLPESGSLIRLLFSVLCPGFLWITSIIICFVLGGFLCFPTEPFFRPFSLWFTALPSSYVRIIHKFFYSYQCLASSFQSVYSVLQLV